MINIFVPCGRPCKKQGALSPIVVVAFSVIVFAGHAMAQTESATLSGTIVDQSGALVPDVGVLVTNEDTEVSVERKTNAAGVYSVPALKPGRYRVAVSKEGFKQVVVRDLVLNVQDVVSRNFTLQVGGTSETVQVQADATLINTQNATVGTVVNRQFVENIPLNGRSFQSLITLTPGVVAVPAGTTNTGGQFSVNGQRASGNSFTVDGVSANFGAAPAFFGNPQTSGNLPSLTTFGTTQSLASVDDVQEFKVQTSTYAAEYGRQPGGQVSIVTRSGTNQLHGSAFDYLRNEAFDANDWFADHAVPPIKKPPERQNDFGGTFGGPIIMPHLYNGRDRTFFFFSYEGLRLRVPLFTLTNVPSLGLRRAAAPGVQPILGAFPLPNGKDLGNGLAEFATSYSNPSSLDATSIRVDHTVNSKLTLFVRYNEAPSRNVTRQPSNLSGLQTQSLNTRTVTLGASTLLTPRVSNELRVNYSGNGAYNAVALDNFGGAAPPPRNVLVPSQYDSNTAQGAVFLLFVGRTSAVVPFLDLHGNGVTSQRQLNIIDNISYSVGSHQLKLGVDYRRLTPIAAFNSYFLQSIFSSQQQVLLGTAGSASVNANVTRKPVFLNFSAYGDDTWRLSRRLTIDLGVRWEFSPAPSEANGNNAVAVSEIQNLATTQLAPLGTKEWKTTYKNFAPRLGVAYQVSQTSGRETVVRGGFGVFYDTGNDFGAINFNSGFPYASTRTVSNVTYPLSPAQVAPLPLPIQAGLTPPYPLFFGFDPVLKLPYTFQWNVAVEQSVGKSQIATVSYVGAAGRRLLQETQLSLSSINPAFTTLLLTRNSATSDYDALQAQFQRRLSRGLQALVSYTWSHALDDDSGSLTSRVAKRGNSAFDVRHVFAAAATYDIPAPGSRPLTRVVLGNWSVDTNIHAQSALPVDLVASTLTDPATGGIINVRPNVNLSVPFYIDDPTVPGGRKINAAAFTAPPTGQSGNLGRNQGRGIGAWQIDFATRRQFKLTEKLNLQFRAEAFNLFNHPNFGTIQTTLNAANFGQATNMLNRQLGGISQLYQIGGPRSLQFALKLIF